MQIAEGDNKTLSKKINQKGREIFRKYTIPAFRRELDVGSGKPPEKISEIQRYID